MNEDVEEIFDWMEDQEFVGGINDNELRLELLKYSTFPLLHMSEGLENYIDVCRQSVKIGGKSIAWDVYDDVCDRELALEAITQPTGFKFPFCGFRNDEKNCPKSC